MSPISFKSMIDELEKYDWQEAADALYNAQTLINQFNALAEWQTGYHRGGRNSMARMHPLTCGNDSKHGLLFAILVDKDRLSLVCPDCDYRQNIWPADMVVKRAAEPPHGAP
jgi:hypothetical protein